MSSVLVQPKLKVLLYEGAGARPLEQRGALLLALLEAGFEVALVREGGVEASLQPSGASALVVLGRFEEAKPEQGLDETGQVSVYFRDLEGKSATEAVSLVEALRETAEVPKPGSWKPWFPVIDYDRCTDCMQCLSFCLFDVYGVDDKGSILVQNQDNCKTDCPACSRVCPDVAIMFPKYRFGPMNGAEVKEQDVQREAMKIDISALLGGDIYKALRERSAKAKSRFSKERDDDRALKERQKCLTKLKDQLDIPPELLSSLPSLDQIQAKAAEAKARAEAARKNIEEEKA